MCLYNLINLDSSFLRQHVQCNNKSCWYLAIYSQGLSAHMEISDNIKKSIKQIGDNTKEPLPFNHDESTNDKFKPSEGKQRRCVTIPHKAMLQHLLR